jgi:insulysin
MKLVVYGKESLEDLEKIVVEKFSNIPNKNLKRKVFDKTPFEEKELKKVLEVVPVK